MKKEKMEPRVYHNFEITAHENRYNSSMSEPNMQVRIGLKIFPTLSKRIRRLVQRSCVARYAGYVARYVGLGGQKLGPV